MMTDNDSIYSIREAQQAAYQARKDAAFKEFLRDVEAKYKSQLTPAEKFGRGVVAPIASFPGKILGAIGIEGGVRYNEDPGYNQSKVGVSIGYDPSITEGRRRQQTKKEQLEERVNKQLYDAFSANYVDPIHGNKIGPNYGFGSGDLDTLQNKVVNQALAEVRAKSQAVEITIPKSSYGFRKEPGFSDQQAFFESTPLTINQMLFTKSQANKDFLAGYAKTRATMLDEKYEGRKAEAHPLKPSTQAEMNLARAIFEAHVQDANRIGNDDTNKLTAAQRRDAREYAADWRANRGSFMTPNPTLEITSHQTVNLLKTAYGKAAGNPEKIEQIRSAWANAKSEADLQNSLRAYAPNVAVSTTPPTPTLEQIGNAIKPLMEKATANQQILDELQADLPRRSESEVTAAYKKVHNAIERKIPIYVRETSPNVMKSLDDLTSAIRKNAHQIGIGGQLNEEIVSKISALKTSIADVKNSYGGDAGFRLKDNVVEEAVAKYLPKLDISPEKVAEITKLQAENEQIAQKVAALQPQFEAAKIAAAAAAKKPDANPETVAKNKKNENWLEQLFADFDPNNLVGSLIKMAMTYFSMSQTGAIASTTKTNTPAGIETDPYAEPAPIGNAVAGAEPAQETNSKATQFASQVVAIFGLQGEEADKAQATVSANAAKYLETKDPTIIENMIADLRTEANKKDPMLAEIGLQLKFLPQIKEAAEQTLGVPPEHATLIAQTAPAAATNPLDLSNLNPNQTMLS